MISENLPRPLMKTIRDISGKGGKLRKLDIHGDYTAVYEELGEACLFLESVEIRYDLPDEYFQPAEDFCVANARLFSGCPHLRELCIT